MYILYSKAVAKTPYELWTGCKPTIGHIHIWGYLAYVLNKDASKSEPHSKVYILWDIYKEHNEVFL